MTATKQPRTIALRNATMQHANLEKLVSRLNLTPKHRDWLLPTMERVERAEMRGCRQMLACHDLREAYRCFRAPRLP